MSQYFFRISHGRYSGASDQGSEFESHETAWAEMTKVCRPSRRHFPQAEAKRRMADGNAGRGQKARIRNPLDGGNAELEPCRYPLRSKTLQPTASSQRRFFAMPGARLCSHPLITIIADSVSGFPSSISAVRDARDG